MVIWLEHLANIYSYINSTSIECDHQESKDSVCTESLMKGITLKGVLHVIRISFVRRDIYAELHLRQCYFMNKQEKVWQTVGKSAQDMFCECCMISAQLTE